MKNSNGYVLVVGSTGFLGTEICRQLVDAKRKVKALVRTTSDPAKVQALKDLGIETVTGDIKDSDSLNKAFKDVSAVISSASSTLSRQQGDSIETVDNQGQLNVVNAAKKAEVDQFIFISFNAMSQEFPLQTAKRAVEKELKESNMNYTVLQPTFFMEVWLSPPLGFDYPNSKVTIYGEGNNKSSWISLKDVAAYAVACLDNAKAMKSVFELGGPDALSPLDIVLLFEKRAGNEFTIEHVPVEALYAQKLAAADPMSESFASLMIAYAEAKEIDMKETLKIVPIRRTSVKDYMKAVLPENEPVLNR